MRPSGMSSTMIRWLFLSLALHLLFFTSCITSFTFAKQNFLERFRSLQEPTKTYDSTRQYLVYRMHNSLGLGNKLLGLISSIVLSIATERTFILDWRDSWNFADVFHVKHGITFTPITVSQVPAHQG